MLACLLACFQDDWNKNIKSVKHFIESMCEEKVVEN